MKSNLLCLAGLLLATPLFAQAKPASSTNQVSEMLAKSAALAAAGDSAQASALAAEALQLMQEPASQDDLQHQLREIHFELEQMRHELQALREQMQGANMGFGLHRGGGMGFAQGFGGFGGGSGFGPQMHWQGFPQPHVLAEEFSGKIQEEMRRHMPKFFFQPDGDDSCCEDEFEFSMDLPEDLEHAEKIMVIINGEVFEGDAAREKLEELQNSGEHPRGGMMKMRFSGGLHSSPEDSTKAPAPAPEKESEDL